MQLLQRSKDNLKKQFRPVTQLTVCNYCKVKKVARQVVKRACVICCNLSEPCLATALLKEQIIIVIFHGPGLELNWCDYQWNKCHICALFMLGLMWIY